MKTSNIKHPIEVMKKNFAAGIFALIAGMMLLPNIAQCQVQWQNYILTITTPNNSLECGIYVSTGQGLANGKGVYYITDYKGTPGTGTPFLQWDGSVWVLENGVGGHTDYFGSDIFPTADTTRGQAVAVSTVAKNVDTRGKPIDATTEPVNIVNGGMFFDETDFGVSGAGFGLEWTRSYNSMLNTTNVLGFCWSHNYDINLQATTNIFIIPNYTNSIPALILNMGAGSARTLLKDVDANIWRSVQAPLLTVYGASNGEYSLSLPSGYSCMFRTNGFIKSISNAWNNALTFAYTNNAGQPLLQSVTHSDGRSLSFSYQSNRLVRLNTPSENLYYEYYYNGGGELTGMVKRLPAGNFWSSYSYDTNGVHAMLQHQNPLGEVFNYTYATNALGQVTPKCIRVAVATNYYEHTVGFGSGSTVVSYSRPGTNATLNYSFDADPTKQYVTSIIGPGETSAVHRLDHDAVTSLVTNEEWSSSTYWDGRYFGGTVNTNPGSFSTPQGLAVDTKGRLYVTDNGYSRIQRYTLSSNTWELLGVSGSSIGQFSIPHGITVDSYDNVYVADTGNFRIQMRNSTNGQWSAIGQLGTNAGQFQIVIDVAVDAIGRLYVLEQERLQRRNTNNVWSILATNGYANGAISGASALTLDTNGFLYVSDYGGLPIGSRLQKLTLSGAFVEIVGSKSTAGFVNSRGNELIQNEVVVSDYDTHDVKIKSGGAWATLITSNVLDGPLGIAWDGKNQILYVADNRDHRVVMTRYPSGGAPITNGVGILNWWGTPTEYITAKSAYNDKLHMTNFWSGYCVTSATPWTFSWNTNIDAISSVVDPLGNRSEWEYTNGSISVERIYPATNQPIETRYGYTSNGFLATITNANGHWVSYESDSCGYQTQTVSQGGTTNSMSWDILGHLTHIQLPSSNLDTNDPPNVIPRTITFDQNELGWVKKITYPDSSIETFDYNSIGALTNHVDVAGRTTILSWLPTKKLASITRYLTTGGSNQAVTIGVTYDQQMNVLSIKDELGRPVESYQLDIQDRPITVTNIERQVMTIKYGLGSMVKNLIRFDGSMVIYGYDEGARMKSVNYGDTSISFNYLKNGLLASVSNSFGIVSNTFDGANRLVSSQSSGLLPQPATVNYGYYHAGQVSNVTSIAGTNVYAFDVDERLSTQTATTPNGRQDSVNYSYDPINGQLAQVTYSNGTTCAYGYDILDRLTVMSWRNVSNVVLKSRSYSYTTAGMISRINTEDGGYIDYSYDSLDRLTREKQVNVYGQITADTKYEFDLAGNRTKKIILDSSGNPFITVGYKLGITNRLASKSVAETNLAVRTDVGGYASEPIGTNDRFGTLWISNAVAGGVVVKPEVQGTNFWSYGLTVGLGTQMFVAAIRDVAGNTTYATNASILSVITNSSVQYNSAGCVTNITGTGPGYTKSVGLTWNSQYQVTSVSTNGGLAGSYKFDALGRRSWAIENGTTNWFIYDGVHVVADLNSAGGLVKSYFWGPGVDNMISMTVYGTATNTYYAIKDHLNSVLAMTDGAGNIVESYRYDAWGRTTVYGSSGVALKSSAIGNRYCWQGREYNFQSGLYYFRARLFDPVAGRWLSNDPLGIAGGFNQYVFCANNPVNFTDPDGCSWLKGIGLGLAGVAVGIVVGAVVVATAPAWAVVALGVTASAAGGFMTGVNTVEYVSGKTYISGQDLSWDDRTTRGGQVLVSAATLGVGGTKWFNKGANSDMDWVKLPASQRLSYSKDLITVADDVAGGFTAPPGQRGVSLLQWRPQNLGTTWKFGADSALRSSLPYGLSGSAFSGAAYDAYNDNCK